MGRVLLFATTVCLVVLAAYQAGQWSLQRSAEEHAAQTSPITAGPEPDETLISPPSLANDTDMASSGKYSVG